MKNEERHKDDFKAALRAFFMARANVQAAVNSARVDGASWRDIGDWAGTTRQAAWERYGKSQKAAPPDDVCQSCGSDLTPDGACGWCG